MSAKTCRHRTPRPPEGRRVTKAKASACPAATIGVWPMPIGSRCSRFCRLSRRFHGQPRI